MREARPLSHSVCGLRWHSEEPSLAWKQTGIGEYRLLYLTLRIPLGGAFLPRTIGVRASPEPQAEVEAPARQPDESALWKYLPQDAPCSA